MIHFPNSTFPPKKIILPNPNLEAIFGKKPSNKAQNTNGRVKKVFLMNSALRLVKNREKI